MPLVVRSMLICTSAFVPELSSYPEITYFWAKPLALSKALIVSDLSAKLFARSCEPNSRKVDPVLGLPEMLLSRTLPEKPVKVSPK
ncbi:hypothetical protein WJ970_33040 [Achromobacter xylosoxidans]